LEGAVVCAWRTVAERSASAAIPKVRLKPDATWVRLKPDTTPVPLKPDATPVRLEPDTTRDTRLTGVVSGFSRTFLVVSGFSRTKVTDVVSGFSRT